MDSNSSSKPQDVVPESRNIRCSYNTQRAYSMNPLVGILFAEAKARRIPIKHVAVKAGLNPDAIYDWRIRTNPTVPNLEACLNVLGLELAVRERDQ